MIRKVGLLPTDNHQQVPFAYKMYPDWLCRLGPVERFQESLSVDVKIEFLDVWYVISTFRTVYAYIIVFGRDTFASVGFSSEHDCPLPHQTRS
jgi:hypothetical protein